MILKLTLFQKALSGLSTSLESYLEAFHNMKKKFDGIKTPETGMILILIEGFLAALILENFKLESIYRKC